MAKAKVKGTRQVQNRIQKILVGALSGRKDLEKITENFKRTIRSESLLDGSKIKPLAQSTIQRRRKLSSVSQSRSCGAILSTMPELSLSIDVLNDSKNRPVKVRFDLAGLKPLPVGLTDDSFLLLCIVLKIAPTGS